jgi:hypothetical protein
MGLAGRLPALQRLLRNQGKRKKAKTKRTEYSLPEHAALPHENLPFFEPVSAKLAYFPSFLYGKRAVC